MASFMESPRFPDDISYGVTFGPEFVTEIASTPAGAEQRNRVRSRALCRGECAHAVKTQAQLTLLIAFFRSVGGRFSGFRFKDWSDYQLALADSVLTDVGVSGAQFQLNKRYRASAGFQEVRPLRKPVTGTLVLKDGASTVAPGVGAGQWTLDASTGVVTIGAGVTRLAGNLTASCEFDVPCRFDADSMATSIQSYQIYSWGQIPVVEISNP